MAMLSKRMMVVLFFLSREASATSCASLAGTTIGGLSMAPLSDARECLLSLSLDTTKAAATKSAIQNYLSMYSYVDILKDYTQEPRFAIQADLPALVDAIALSGSEMSFHQSLVLAVRKNRDVHTQYTMPTCLSDWRYFAPLTTFAYKSGDELVLTVAGTDAFSSEYADLCTFSSSATASTFDSGNELEVLSIDGQPWVTYYQAWADKFLSNSRDPNSRLNEAISPLFQGGPFNWVSVLPDADSISVEFRDTSSGQLLTAVFPLLAAYQSGTGTIPSSIDCSSITRRDLEPPGRQYDTLMDPMIQNPDIKPIRRTSRRGATDYTTYPGFTPNSSVIKLMEDTVAKVFVMKLSSFLPDNPTAFVEDFASATTIAADGLASGAYTKFVIDVRSNGGGYVILRDFGIYCLTGFTGSDTTRFTMPGLVRHNKGFDWVAQACSDCIQTEIPTEDARCKACNNKLGMLVGDPAQWGPNGSYVPFASTAAEYCPNGGEPGSSCKGQQWKRDGSTCSQFTATLYDQINPLEDFNSPSWVCPKSFTPGNTQLYLLSDGRCGSACSMFSRSLQDLDYATSVVVGGQLDTPQQVASFGGGQVWDDVQSDLPTLFSQIAQGSDRVATDQWPVIENFPGTLPQAGQAFSFVPQETQDVMREDVNTLKYPGIPAEFVFEPAAIRLHLSQDSSGSLFSTQTSDYYLYEEVRQRIEACAPVNVDCRECEASGGVNGCGVTDLSLDLCSDDNDDSWWEPWRIALIVAAGVVFVALVVVAVVWFCKRRQSADESAASNRRASTELDDAFSVDDGVAVPSMGAPSVSIGSKQDQSPSDQAISV